MAGSYRAIYIGSDPKKKETPDGQTLQALGELNPNLEPWTNFETGEVDWDGFYTAKEKLIASLSPAVEKAYEAFVAKSVDPDLKKIEPQIRQAKELRRGFFDIPKWLSIVKNQGKLVEVQELARQKALDLARQGFPEVDSQTVYELVGVEIDDLQTALMAYRLRPGSQTDLELRDPERDRFLMDNVALLEKFFPDMYRRGWLSVPMGVKEISRPWRRGGGK